MLRSKVKEIRMTDQNPTPLSFPSDRPLDLFSEWLKEAQLSEPNDPNAMALASIDPDGRPGVRIVLMRGHDERGFQFYTNYTSRKGVSLISNPFAEANFYWKTLHKQIRISGAVEKTTAQESDDYYNSRYRGSRIGAWASKQSSVLPHYEHLQKEVEAFEKKFEGREDIPRPEHWGGFRLIPSRMEFWHEQPFRLHKRFVYTKDESGSWQINWLYP